MDNLVCTECGMTYYSAAARHMVERGERCDCGGALREADEFDRIVVGARIDAPESGGHSVARDTRRFAREGATPPTE